MLGIDFKKQLQIQARAIGFSDTRVADAILPPEAGTRYKDWIQDGLHGEMSYMERLVEERSSGVEHILPGTKSVIVLTAPYWFSNESEKKPDPNPKLAVPGDGHVRIARYALGKDYHYVLKDRLRILEEWLSGQYPEDKWRICVDSAPLLERSYALASGIGFIGKNTMVISWMGGSFTFLAEILTTAVIEPDEPRWGTCGNCTRCLDACPTQAFTGPGRLDARKCISYLTIEKKSTLSATEVADTGDWLFGCDICQDVCPYNKSPEVSRIDDFRPGTIVSAVEHEDVFLSLKTNGQFKKRFSSSPLMRGGKNRLQRLVLAKRDQPSD